jgi:hypothetical protein
MINEVTIEGIVTANRGRTTGGAGTMFSIQNGQHVRIHDFLQSCEFEESLAEFLEKVH